MARAPDKNYRSEIAGVIHEMMKDAHEAGVTSSASLRNIADACFDPASVLDVECVPVAPKVKAEPNAAHNQDFLYGEDGLPE